MGTLGYRLSRDTYACLADDYLVFSNIGTDRYHCLSPANTRIFAPYLLADPSSPAPDQPCDDSMRAWRIGEVLINSGLLVDGSPEMRESHRTADIPKALDSLDSDDRWQPLGIRFKTVSLFLRASMRASFALRFRSFGQTLRAVERRRRANASPSDEARIRNAVTTFSVLRPYYPRSYICRFDSLALIEFLAELEQYPLWVFGVKSKPFGAHCWVQFGQLVLNDNIEYIRRFTPIMVF